MLENAKVKRMDDFTEIVQINTALEDFFDHLLQEAFVRDSFTKFLLETTRDSVLSGGKRLRPLSLYKAYKLVSQKENEEVLKLSLSVELYHSSTLIHDDIMDEDSQRRGLDSVFEKVRKYYEAEVLKEEDEVSNLLFNSRCSRFAVSQGLLAGNILAAISVNPILQSNFDEKKKVECLKILCDCQKVINSGQVMDSFFEISKNVTEETYLEMVRAKTGLLFVSSIQMGLVLAGCNLGLLRKMTEYAHLVSEAFQIQDDLMDISEISQKGHEFGSDIKQGKKTLLVIKALEFVDSTEKSFLEESLGNPDCDIDRCVVIIKKSGAYDYVQSLAKKKVAEAVNLISNVPHNSYFVNLANFVVNREK